MKNWLAQSSPALKARFAGILYLFTGMAFVFADSFVRGKLVVADNAAATAHNILAHETLYRMGFAADLISAVGFIAVTLLFFDIFKPVNKSIALLAAFFSLAGCTIQAFICFLHLAALVILGGVQYLSAMKLEQLQDLALLSLNLHAQANCIYMVFFGMYNILLGCLILRSRFLPRIIGIFMIIAGLTYQAFLFPPLAQSLFPFLIGPAGALGELSLVFWLILFGVNSQRWNEQASAANTI
jgi:hypothetical protein